MDGIFGPMTEEGVKEFQRANGLKVDGICGPQTWAKLFPGGQPRVVTRKLNEIILHCTSSWEGQHWTVEGIRQMHIKERGWSDIGYNFVVYLDGSVHAGRSLNVTGAHCLGHNTNSIGIVYVGGMRRNAAGKGVPADTRTPAQKKALVELVDKLCRQYGISKQHVYGHYEFANKACPAFDVKKEFRS